jgi:hypothetical protein
VATIEQVVAAIPVAFGADYSGKAWSKGGRDRVYVTRYGRQERGYVEVLSETQVSCDQLNLAGMRDETVQAKLDAALATMGAE